MKGPSGAAERITDGTIRAFAGVFFIGLGIFVVAMGRASGIGQPVPIMAILFADLAAAVGCLLLIEAADKVFPGFRFFSHLAARLGRHLAVIGVLSGLFVGLMIVTGILCALGIL